MADHFAARAYHSEIDHLRGHIFRTSADVRRHLDTIEAWAGNNSEVLPQTRNLGTDVATLTEQVATLKALLDAAYLLDGA